MFNRNEQLSQNGKLDLQSERFYLLVQIGISDEESATRIALYLFAQDVNMSIEDIWTDKAKFTNYTEVEAIIDKLARKEIFGVVGKLKTASSYLNCIKWQFLVDNIWREIEPLYTWQT